MVVAEKLNFIIMQNEKSRLSHAFLIETNNINMCLKDVKNIVKIINCPHKYHEDCNESCNLCKLIDQNNLPSLVIIEPDGMSIKKSQMLELEEKFNSKPVYSKFNSYIILNADKMNESSSNTILKFLEEPEDDIVGFFIVSNKENILSTIKSRCEIVHVDYEVIDEMDNELKIIADKYLDDIFNSDDYLINRVDILEKYSDRKDIESLFLIIFDNYYKKYVASFKNEESTDILAKQLEIIEKTLKFIQTNVNLELLLDSFVIEMRRSNG